MMKADQVIRHTRVQAKIRDHVYRGRILTSGLWCCDNHLCAKVRLLGDGGAIVEQWVPLVDLDELPPERVRLAREISVGDWVEFDEGRNLRVVKIEELTEEEENGDPYFRQRREEHGPALMFTCSLYDTEQVLTFYTRRHHSPVSGPGVIR